MEKCKVCSKSLKGAVKSAKREDGTYFIIGRNCGNVMRVGVSEGLTTICRTPEGYSDVLQHGQGSAVVTDLNGGTQQAEKRLRHGVHAVCDNRRHAACGKAHRNGAEDTGARRCVLTFGV